MNVKQLLLYLRTVRYLKSRQLVYFVLRRIIPVKTVNSYNEEILLRKNVRMCTVISYSVTSLSKDEFRFLNVSKAFDLNCMDWISKEMPKLWRYNLHYFDYVHDRNRSKEHISELISDWIVKNPPGLEDAWEPYTVSLRVVNWIKLFLQEEFTGLVTKDLLCSLYQQALWLEKNIEYHILANHYLKNGKALFFAGVFFDGQDAKRWLKKGLKILTEEAKEQILDDGGHYERSPMYHSIVVEDYLDVLNLMISNLDIVEPSVINYFKVKTALALDFLNDICLPDDNIPLFDDSAFGIAPAPDKIFEYAHRIMGYNRPTPVTGLSVIAKEASGYFVVRHDKDMLVVDCGPVGPDYQPGHAHCDTLSYELAIDGRRLVVDSGVYDYEDSPERQYARSTRGHNTVVADGNEQSEIWGVFRVARRARPLKATLEKLGEIQARFEGAHDGYRRLPGKVIHQRIIDYDTASGWIIRDELLGTGTHQMESFIHLHPDFNATIENNSIRVTDYSGRCIVIINVIGQVETKLGKGWYFPEFGLHHENVLIKLSCTGELPLQITYEIIKNNLNLYIKKNQVFQINKRA